MLQVVQDYVRTSEELEQIDLKYRDYCLNRAGVRLVLASFLHQRGESTASREQLQLALDTVADYHPSVPDKLTRLATLRAEAVQLSTAIGLAATSL